MENKQSPSKKKLSTIQKEKIIREVNYDSITRSNCVCQAKKELFLDLEILQKHPTQSKTSQRVLVSIKPRAPAIKTLYLAEKTRFYTKRSSEKSRSRLAIGDHSSIATHFSDDDLSNLNNSKQKINIEKEPSVLEQMKSTISAPKYSMFNEITQERITCNEKLGSTEKCYIQPQITMNVSKFDSSIAKPKITNNKVDIATLIITNTSSNNSSKHSSNIIYKLQTRVDNLERKVLKQEMVFRSIDPIKQLSSSNDESNENMNLISSTERPGCSYIEQYSHIPETSAFQRYAHQTAPLSPSKATTIDKEHNSEQYGRNFTAYDGITARGRRQSASVPCKRDELPNLAAERMHKIRHKLNPVRDYRLMDTVHYLAQGEFAPRDDGIKLTPSREAVLSDIIWEDVCRTHWPNTRLGRRGAHNERYSTKSELQRLIDSLLRERVAHVERRRRRHYRIVKLNHRHENCRPLGKTGDIIVASHKNREISNGKQLIISNHKGATCTLSNNQSDSQNLQQYPRSYERMVFSERRQRCNHVEEECTPGPSYAKPRSSVNRESACCYQTSSINKNETIKNNNKAYCEGQGQKLTSESSASTCKPHGKKPRLLVKKEPPYRKYHTRDECNLEHYILLPTLVVRTPSNVKRQKKFNELYHRILNVKMNNEHSAIGFEAEQRASQNTNLKDVGLNINIQMSTSEEGACNEKSD